MGAVVCPHPACLFAPSSPACVPGCPGAHHLTVVSPLPCRLQCQPCTGVQCQRCNGNINFCETCNIGFTSVNGVCTANDACLFNVANCGTCNVGDPALCATCTAGYTLVGQEVRRREGQGRW